MPQDPQGEVPLAFPRTQVSGMPVQLGPGVQGTYTGDTSKLYHGVTPVPEETTAPRVYRSSNEWMSRANKANYDRATASMESAFKDAQDRKAISLAAKYSSIASMAKSEKIEALKDPSMNPFLMAADNAYDGLAAGYHKWSVIGAKAAALPQEQRIQIAKNFRQQMLLPLYANLGREPISEDTWLRAAYDKDGALGYKVESAYSTFKSLKQGWGSFTKDAANAEETVVNLLGRALHEGAKMQKPGTWAQDMIDAQNNKEGFFEKNRRVTQDMPILGEFSRMADWDSSMHSFWHEAIPNWNFTEKTLAVVAEAAPQLGLFKALSAVNEALVGGAGKAVLSKVPYGNLTAALAKSPAGKFMAKTLLAGTENVLYGRLTKDQNDKDGALKDMLLGMVLSAPFNFKGKTGTIADHFPESAKAQAIGRKASEVADHVANKTREGTPAEYHAEFKNDMQNNVTAVGVQGQAAIDEHALAKAQEWEALSPAEQRRARAAFVDEDKVQHSPVAAAATKIQQLAKSSGRSLKEIVANPVLKNQLNKTLEGMRTEAAANIHQTEGVTTATAQQAATKARIPGAGVVRDLVKKKMMAQPQVATALKAGQIKPEQFEQMVDVEYGKAVAKAAQLAEKKAQQATRTASKGQKIGAQRVAAEAKIKPPKTDPGRMKERTTYKKNRDEITVTYGLSKVWDTYLKTQSLASKTNAELERHLQNLGTEDFSDLMHEFLPPQLKDQGIHFESQWEAQRGPNNPNLYGFMYNYMKFLPKPLQKELPNRLMETLKIANNMPKNYQMTEGMLQFFAKSMFNHVDNFLTSARSASESNIFRSTLPNLTDPTAWQNMSLVERMAQDTKIVKSMFVGHPAEAASALKVVQAFHQQLAQLATDAKTNMTPGLYKKISDQLADFLVQKSHEPQARFQVEKYDYDYETTGGYR